LPAGRLNIGLACCGSAAYRNDWKRSMPLRLFQPLARHANLLLLQKDLRPSDREDLAICPELTFLGDRIGDFADTAAIVQRLDLVISVDTSLAHLAGALAKPVWILLPHSPDWRWMLERPDSPWYPGARLFRQSAPGDWAGVIGQVSDALAAIPAAGSHEDQSKS
jgi:hypothetical protein